MYHQNVLADFEEQAPSSMLRAPFDALNRAETALENLSLGSQTDWINVKEIKLFLEIVPNNIEAPRRLIDLISANWNEEVLQG